MAKTDFEWIRRRLMAKGYTQAQLAKIWDTDSGFVSRFFADGRTDLITLKRAVMLCRIIEMPLEDFVKQIGLHGGSVMAPSLEPTSLPDAGTFNVTPRNGALQIIANLTVPAAKAGELLTILANLTKK